ncbi:MAG: DegT/DnrJ/EryC1/StrS family aminotransferase [Desulfobacterota bacterium]|nr:DegT/DnrJ/EryC1/StrS family aminotransferase [Thermodesulfobacteriota bacterium]
MQIPLAAPDITEKGRAAVLDVLKTNTLSFGPRLTEFEEVAAAFAGRSFGVAVNSGTSALHLIVRALGIGHGDRVITTPFSFIASANCILFERAEPVFVDIDERDLNLRPDLVEEALKKDRHRKIKAILAVDIFGYPAAWDELSRIAEKYGVALIEDSSEALGSAYRSPEHIAHPLWRFYKRTGSFGDAGVFAFYPNKQITTGEGGMILTDNRKIYDLCRSMRNQGRTDEGGWLGHVRLGYNYRISDINCALGISQLSRIDEILKKRETVALKYTDRLRGCNDLLVPYQAPHVKIGWFVYVVRLQRTFTRRQRDTIMTILKEKGIETGNYFPPIHLQPFYRTAFGYKRGNFPVTERVADRTIALPFHNNLQDHEIDYVVEHLLEAIAAVRDKQRETSLR